MGEYAMKNGIRTIEANQNRIMYILRQLFKLHQLQLLEQVLGDAHRAHSGEVVLDIFVRHLRLETADKDLPMPGLGLLRVDLLSIDDVLSLAKDLSTDVGRRWG